MNKEIAPYSLWHDIKKRKCRDKYSQAFKTMAQAGVTVKQAAQAFRDTAHLSNEFERQLKSINSL